MVTAAHGIGLALAQASRRGPPEHDPTSDDRTLFLGGDTAGS